jgi:beta-glucosidase/6-phospho-beta-glucosidase/beta-galactosidase
MRRFAVSLALALLAALALAAPGSAVAGTAATAQADGDATRPFPRGFLWGVASSGFQTEAGGRPANADRRADWHAWTTDPENIRTGRVSGDRVEDGPGVWRPARFRADLRLARRTVHARVFRLGLEWSRIFPRSTAGVRLSARPTRRQLRRLDRLASRRAVRRYRGMLRDVRRAGLRPFVTVTHFTLPRWVHDPIATRDALAGRDPDADLPAFRRPAGWLDARTVAEFRKYAAYLAWRFGDLVDTWTPLNEPLVVATSGYVNVPGVLAGNFPPGAYSFTAAVTAIEHQARANAAAYDAIKRLDRGSRVGLVHNLIAFTPADPGSALDRRGTEHADYLFNRLWLDATLRGLTDRNADGRIDPSERDPAAAGKADFVGVNVYFRGRISGLPAPLSRRIPLLDFLPQTSYASPVNPAGPPCPSTCSDFGNELYPQGLRDVLATAGEYRKPVYITESGIADAGDALRRRYLVQHLAVLREAMADRVADVRGWLHWSLVDNFEWAVGLRTHFGLYGYDPRTLRRTARPSARLVGGIFGANRIAPAVLRRLGTPALGAP